MVAITKVSVVVTLACVAGFSLAVHGRQSQSDGPRYVNGTNLVRPLDYCEWPFIGSGSA